MFYLIVDALARRLAADVDSAFADLVRAHQHAVFAIALRSTGDRGEAEDVAQEVFVRAYHALRQWGAARIEALAPRPWLATIALNTCRNRARSAARRPPSIPAAPAAGGADEAAALDGPLAAALAALPPHQRDAVVLRHAADLPVAAVAEILDRPLGTVKSDIHRALEQLRRTLRRDDR